MKTNFLAHKLNNKKSLCKKVLVHTMIFLILWPSLLPITYALPILNKATDDKDIPINPALPRTSVQLAGDTIVVRHAPNLNSGGRVEGSVRVLTGEAMNINGATITNDLFVQGTPVIHNNGGNINYNGTVVGTGSTQPANYSINLNSNTSLRHIVTQSDPITIDPVANPPQPTGTVTITLNQGNQPPASFTNVRNITLNSNYGSLSVPPGTYGNITLNSNDTLVIGTANQSTVYNLQQLVLNSNSTIQIVGTVTINLANQLNLNSNTTVGSSSTPAQLALNLANGGLNLNSNSNLYAIVKTPTGSANLNAGSKLKGLLVCNQLNLNSNALVQNLVSDSVAPVVTINQPTEGAIIRQSQVTVSGTVVDDSLTTVKINGTTVSLVGNTFTGTVTLNSLGANTITVTATDAFNNTGTATRNIQRADATNQAPVIQIPGNLVVALPNSLTINASAIDDGLPSGSHLSVSWTKASGPGNVTFSNNGTTAITTATFSVEGTYVLKLAATDGQLTTTALAMVTVTPATTTNLAPVVTAPANQTVVLPGVATLAATVTDDGLPSPPAQVTVNWTQVSSSTNGVTTFSNPTSVNTTASFNIPGTYVLRLTANDSALSASADTTVIVKDQMADFTITATPASATAVQNGTTNYMVTVMGNDANFNQLTSLTIANLPSTIRTTFTPQQLSSGATSTLTLDLNNSGVTPGSYNFQVVGTALIQGSNISHTANLTLVVTAASQTSLSGRVLSTDGDPILGATVSIDGHTATTNSAGNFVLMGVLAGNKRAVMVDGRTASAPGRTYPVIAEPIDIIGGQPNIVPYIFYLPAIDIQYEVTVVPNQQTIVTTPRVNGLKVTIPANANLRNRDGSPVTRVSLTPVPFDRTPAPLPSNVSTGLVFSIQPGGALSDAPIAISFPNLLEAPPASMVQLYRFNHDTVQWEVYGTGTVSNDGRTIEPNIDPATGQPYGIKDFSWFLGATGGGGSGGGGNGSSGDSCPPSDTNNPVDLPSGYKVESSTDIAIGGVRGGLSLTRIYTNGLAAFGDNSHRFGLGTKDNYDYGLNRLETRFGNGDAIYFASPNESMGHRFSYIATESDGTKAYNSTGIITSRLGDIVHKFTDGTYQYKYETGEIMQFNTNGQMTAMIDRNGNTTTLAYTNSLLTTVTDPTGRTLTFTYNVNKHVSSVTDPIGRTWTYTYSTLLTNPTFEQLQSVTDPLGHSMLYVYDTVARLTQVYDKRGNKIKGIGYNQQGYVTSQTFADGGTTTYEYTFAGAIVSGAKVTDPQGRVTSKRFTPNGYVIEDVDGLGQVSRIDRDINTGLPTQVTGPCGCAESVKDFDFRGNVIKETDRLGQVMTMEYEPIFNNMTKMTDKKGHVTTYIYDNKGNKISITNANGEVTTWTYDQFGEMTSMRDTLNHLWTMTYDSQGNNTSRTDPLNNTSTMTYDGIGRMLSMIDPLGRTSSTSYDPEGRIATRTEPSGAVTTYTYDNDGRQLTMTDALNHTWTMEYNSTGQLISNTYPLVTGETTPRKMQKFYNLDNEVVKIISPSGRTALYTYDARGQRKTATDPINGTMIYNYDINHNMISLTDQKGNTNLWDYDELYRLITTTDPKGNITRIAYDANNNITTEIDRLNRTTNIMYDVLNRPSTIQYTDATITYQYDGAGRKTRVDDSEFGGTFISWNYDNANRLLSETTPQGIVSYTYNQATQKSTMAVTNRPPVNYTYDSAGRLSTISQTLTGNLETFTYNYDILSRRTNLQRPNNITSMYSYDENNRLTRITHQKGSDPAIEDFQYTFDTDDEIASISSLFSTTLQPTQTTITPSDATNRITQSNNTNYNFNNIGETINKIVPGQGTSNYTWDHRGRLIQITLPNGQTTNYSYDASNRRISSSNNNVATTYMYDHLDTVLDNNNGAFTDYINNVGTDEKLRMANSTGTLYFIQDRLNTTHCLTNQNGEVIERIHYSAFGNSSGSVLTRYTFTGREGELSSNLFYYRARWYDPEQQRFLSEDPIGVLSQNRLTTNLYPYVYNNPLIFTDPSGKTISSDNKDTCDPSDRFRINTALEIIVDLLKEDPKIMQIYPSKRGCLPCNLKDKVLDAIANHLQIECDYAFIPDPMDSENTPCAHINMFTHIITVNSYGLGHKSLNELGGVFHNKVCSCLQQTLLHEILHNFLPRHKLDDDPSKDPSRKCFSCK